MSDDLTYGGITRNSQTGTPYFMGGEGGSVTLKMLQDGIARLAEIDRIQGEKDLEFAKQMVPYNHLASTNALAYMAAYRLTRSGIYYECALHPEDAKRLTTILESA